MNIVIFNHYALVPEMGGGTRHYDFAKELVSRGHKVSIVASSFHYSSYQEMKVYLKSSYLHEEIDGMEFIWIKTRPYKGNGVRRVMNMLDYMIKAKNIDFTNKPDVIIGSSVHLFAVYAAYKQSQRLSLPFVMEVRDIWPQTLIDMGISAWHPFIIGLGYLEKYLYKKADKIITLLPEADKYIEKFNINKEDIVWISNGVDVSKFKGLKSEQKEKEFLITYMGSMGQANVLHTLMEVAKRLKDKEIRFQLIGEGELKKELQEYKEKQTLTNVKILDLISKDKVPQVLKNSDLLYLGLKDSPLYRFGVSLNKLFDYLAAEVPIVFASEIKKNPVEEANAGLCIAPENTDLLEKAIISMYKMSEKERKPFGEGNINYIENNFSIQFLTNKLEKLLNGLV